MASLTKRAGIWTARIYLNGGERWRSLGTSNRQEAERLARELEDRLKGRRWLRCQFEALLDRARRDLRPDEAPLLCETLAEALAEILQLVPSGRRDALALAFSRRLVEQQQRKLALADGWTAWLASANRATLPKARTLGGYAGIWRQFAEWAAGRRLAWLHEVDEAAALAYAHHLWASRVTPRTFTAHVGFLRGVWKTLRVPAGLSLGNPWDAVKPKAPPADTGRRDLTPDELRRVLAAAAGSMRRLLLAGALTGARLGDIASMRWTDLDLETGEWSFIPQKTSRTGRRLAIPLHQPLLDELRAAHGVTLDPLVLPAEHDLWRRGRLTRRLSAHFEACGIATQEHTSGGQPRRKARVLVGFHSLRHTVATLAAKSGANLALVQKTLGHSTAGMTARYTHADPDSARAVLAPLARLVALPPVAGRTAA